MVLQRKLVGVVEEGKEELVSFDEHLLPLPQGTEDAPIQLRVGLDDKGPYLTGAKVKEGEILFINQRHKNGSEIRVSHEFFKEGRFPIDFQKYECALHVLNAKPSAFIELVDMYDKENRCSKRSQS